MNAISKIAEAIHEPGIYLDLPEDEYHADPSLSASGVKLITVSPLDFWVESPFNENKREKGSEAKDLGKAYHKMILEGPEAFEATYAVAPDKEDYPDALDGSDALKERCRELGLPVSGTIAALCQRIREADPDAVLWPDIKAKFVAENDGLLTMTKDQWHGMKLVQAVMARLDSAKDIFTGGAPEVSIFWRDHDFGGIPMKARLDKLRLADILDLKTFANVMKKEVVSAVANEIARNRYYIQPPFYRRAVMRAREMYRRAGGDVLIGGTDDVRIEAVKALTNEAPPRFWFVFVQTGGIPNIVVREFAEFETYKGLGGTQNAYWFRGEMDMRRGISLYRQCVEAFKPGEPWVADFGTKAFSDNDFPLWMLNTPEAAA